MQNKKIRVLDFFAGTGAFDSALDRLGIEYELVDAVEIDKYAMASFNAVHGTNFECQDITKWDKDVGEIDILWQSSPCQSISAAGKGHGADKGSGTRSSLVWEIIRIVEKVKPAIIIWENVKGLVSKKHKHNHTEYMNELEKLGYNSYWKVLNSKNFCVPQNRDRCFTVSIRKDIDNGNFEFPEDTLLTRRLKDILEPSVDEKYYISSKQLAGMARTKFNSYSLKNLLRDKDGEAKTLTARFEGCPQLVDQPLYQKAIDTACEKGMVKPTDVVEYTYSNARTKEVEQGYIKKQNQGNSDIMPTLRTNPQQLGVVVEEPKLDFVGGIGDKDRIGDGKKLSRNYPEGNRVYSANGIAKTQAAQGGGIGGVSGLYEIDEPFIAASRGRSKGDWSESEHYQQLEPREDGLTNTISSVAKDNYVCEPQPVKRRRTEYGKQVRKAYENHEIEANENMRENYIANDGIMPTLTASKREQKIAEPNLKTKLCNDLVEQGIVHGGEVINHSYTNSNQRKELKDYIENDTGVMPTLTTRPDIMGYVEGPGENLSYNNLHENTSKNTREILQTLREKIGDEEFCEWAIGGLCRILEESVLRQNLYAKELLKNWEEYPDTIQRKNISKVGERAVFNEDQVRNMWKEWQTRCSSYGPQLSEQQFREFESFMQKLPHETASQKEFVQGLWCSCKGIRSLQQTLYKIQKIWQPTNSSWERNVRIRKLSPLECWRLQAYHDDEFERAEKVCSHAQLYKQAGNGCTVSVLAALMSQLDILGVKPWNEMSLKEREKLVYV